MMQPQIPVSLGELLDKISILKIKSQRIKDTGKLVNVKKELSYLEKVCKDIQFDLNHPYVKELVDINTKLWEIEDNIRDKERKKEFDDEFVQIARSVYISNDQRCEIKKKINLEFSSELIEEKSHVIY